MEVAWAKLGLTSNLLSKSSVATTGRRRGGDRSARGTGKVPVSAEASTFPSQAVMFPHPEGLLLLVKRACWLGPRVCIIDANVLPL